jgi:hypothetical protein
MPFLNIHSNMNNNKNKDNKRPHRMINVSFPPAKYGLIAAIVIIIICLVLFYL